MIATIIVDDERPARQKLRTLLAAHDDVEIVRECANGDEAVEAIHELHPDLVFLDVQMPGRDGFGVVREAAGLTKHVVFVTAYDQYAVKAFEVQALDYLLKPFDRTRLEQTMTRVRERIRNGSGDLQDRLRAMLDEVSARGASVDRVMIKTAGRITFLRVAEIEWIEAADNYVRIHAGRERHLIRETMNNFETQLDRRNFVRVHRSAIVNVDAIVEIRSLFHGDFSLLLKTGAEIPLGRAYRERLEGALGRAL
jgi:two-component system LytT family response regulator